MPASTIGSCCDGITMRGRRSVSPEGLSNAWWQSAGRRLRHAIARAEWNLIEEMIRVWLCPQGDRKNAGDELMDLRCKRIVATAASSASKRLRRSNRVLAGPERRRLHRGAQLRQRKRHHRLTEISCELADDHGPFEAAHRNACQFRTQNAPTLSSGGVLV